MKVSPNHPSVRASGDDTRARVVLAMLDMDRPTIRALSLATRLPHATVYGALLTLRAQGILDWEDGHKGTLHLLVRPVPFG